MQTKVKTIFSCRECGQTASKWSGQCGGCLAWNSLEETLDTGQKKKAVDYQKSGYAGIQTNNVTPLADVEINQTTRFLSGNSEFDRALGGGIVSGSIVLVGGDPGIGKSTILLQALCALAQKHTTLYVTGEESLQQVKLRAERLQLHADQLPLLAETCVEQIIQQAAQLKPQFIVIDSIQTMYTSLLQSAPGSVSQVRESTQQLVQFAKSTGTAIFLVGHVTKEGMLAGPRVLEHMVDTVLYFEGDGHAKFRLMRAVKNRFGPVNEVGIFAMTETGLKGVSNPSAIFLSNRQAEPAPGTVVMVTWEGTRPMLVEIQSLVDAAHGPSSKRLTVGVELNRLTLILAVLHRHGGVITYDQDVYLNVVGGVKVTETGIDLPSALAIVSSLHNKALDPKLVSFGEIGLSGEIRPVQNGQARLKEAAKLGFKQAIISHANIDAKTKIPGLEVHGVKTLQQALALL